MLRLILFVLGASAIVIGASIFFLGADQTALATESTYNAVTGQSPDPSPGFGKTGESELRFFASYWMAYGVLLVMAAQKLSDRLHWVPPLAGVFFVGGLGRLLAWGAVGAPHPAFLVLMGIELTLPLIIIALWFAGRRKA